MKALIKFLDSILLQWPVEFKQINPVYDRDLPSRGRPGLGSEHSFAPSLTPDLSLGSGAREVVPLSLAHNKCGASWRHCQPLETLALVRRRDEQGGMTGGAVQFWARKHSFRLAFLNLRSLSMVSDGSTGLSALVTAFYNPQTGFAGPPPVEGADCGEGPPRRRRRAGRRLSAYKLLQAWSNQLFQLVGLQLEDF